MTDTTVRIKYREFEKRARDARDSWIKEMLRGSRIEERVKKQLNASMDSMLWYILGLEKRFGNEWSISRVNGREPAIYHAISEAVEDRAVAFVADALNDPPKLSKGQRDTIRKAYIDQLAWRARELAGDEGARAATDALDRVLSELDDETKPYCPVCQVNHLEPLHEEVA